MIFTVARMKVLQVCCVSFNPHLFQIRFIAKIIIIIRIVTFRLVFTSQRIWYLYVQFTFYACVLFNGLGSDPFFSMCLRSRMGLVNCQLF